MVSEFDFRSVSPTCFAGDIEGVNQMRARWYQPHLYKKWFPGYTLPDVLTCHIKYVYFVNSMVAGQRMRYRPLYRIIFMIWSRQRMLSCHIVTPQDSVRRIPFLEIGASACQKLCAWLPFLGSRIGETWETFGSTFPTNLSSFWHVLAFWHFRLHEQLLAKQDHCCS